MLAHVVMNYDVKLENEEYGRPKSVHFGSVIIPNPTGRVCFRRRAE